MESSQIELRKLKEMLEETRKRIPKSEINENQLKELKCELNKRDMEIIENKNIQRNYKNEKQRLNTENERLQVKLQNIMQSLEKIDSEKMKFKTDNEALIDKLKIMTEDFNVKNELISSYKEEVLKYESILKSKDQEIIVNP